MNKVLLIIITFTLSQNINAFELNNNETISFDVEAESMASELFVNIPNDATTLKVEIANGIENSNFDLFLKYQSDFTSSDFSGLKNEANYYSIGIDDNEYFTISTAMNFPLRAGKWYIGVYNLGQTTQNINLSITYNDLPLTKPEVQFIFDQDTIVGSNGTLPCDISGWTDPTPFAAQSGNNASTLGEARMLAIQLAADIVVENLHSTVPLVIQACWPDLETVNGLTTISQSGPRPLTENTPGLIPDTWYPKALVERLSGTKACKLTGGNCDAPVSIMSFNQRIDTDAALGDRRWYYGLNSTNSSTDIDFVSNVIHRLMHNIGFATAMHRKSEDEVIDCPDLGPTNHTLGTLYCNQTDIYTTFLLRHNEDDTITALDSLATDQEREDAIRTSNRLLWDSEFTAQSEFNVRQDQGLGLVTLHSPLFDAGPASVLHLSTSYTEEIMRPDSTTNTRIMGLTTPMLWDLGWDPRPKIIEQNDQVVPGLYYDPEHNGHGFGIEPIANSDQYFLIFYSYLEDGTPEWYTAVSTLSDNILTSTVLNRVTYDFSIDPTGDGLPLIIDDSIERTIAIDFNNSTTNDSSCADSSTAVASWHIGDQTDDWCIEPIETAIGAPPSENDFGGTWWTGIDDDGWGISISFTDNAVIVVTVYYFDVDGNPRWVQGTQSGFEVGQEISMIMRQIEGYGRDEVPPEVFNLLDTGSLSLVINGNSGEDQGTISLDITYQGIEGGSWIRSNVPVEIFTERH